MDTQKTDNLIIVSNRELYIHKRSKTGIVCEKNTGGLVSSIDATMRSGLWIAWESSDADFIFDEKIDLPPEHQRYSLKRIQTHKGRDR
jgi:trehalose 6-phosphate synthase